MLPPRVLVLLVLLGTCLSLDPVGLLAEARVSVEDTFVRGLLSGAATRAAKELLLHPIDTVKTRLQLPGANRGSGGLLSDLYSGVVPAVVGGVSHTRPLASLPWLADPRRGSVLRSEGRLSAAAPRPGPRQSAGYRTRRESRQPPLLAGALSGGAPQDPAAGLPQLLCRAEGLRQQRGP